MPFTLRVNGEDVWSTDLQVEQVSLQSARGEAGRIGISTEGVVDVIVAEVAPGGPRRLDHVENAERRATREAVGEGDARGNLAADRYVLPRDTAVTQGEHDYTLRPGGPDTEAPAANFPSRDLAAGAADDDERNARVEAFNSSGDADEAIANNSKNDDGDNQNASDARQSEAVKAQKEQQEGLASGAPEGNRDISIHENASSDASDGPTFNVGGGDGEGNKYA